MEALAIFGAASSIISSIDIATRCINSLRALKQRWDDTDLTITLLIGHVTTLKAALGQISSLMSHTSPLDNQLVADLGQSLERCVTLITFIDEHISSLLTDQNGELRFRSKTPSCVGRQPNTRLYRPSPQSNCSSQPTIDGVDLVLPFLLAFTS